jgi:transketolase
MQSLTIYPRAEFDRVRELNVSKADSAALFANMARVNTLSMIMAAGSGHIGTSFSSLDIISWLFLNEMRIPDRPSSDAEHDIFFSSKGHDAPALYAVMIAVGLLPEDLLLRLRRKDGLPGHPDVTSTPFIESNTGSLGMGISKAKGFAEANRIKGRDARVFVLTGDGELQEGQIWESLGSAVRRRMSEVTVIVDHNKVQSDTLVRETADLGDLQAKFAAFGWNVLRCGGHDIEAFAQSVQAARAEKSRPTVIIADTIKGRGVSFMEHTAMDGRWYRYHSGAPSAEEYARGIAELSQAVRGQSAVLGFGAPQESSVPAPARSPSPAKPQRMVRRYGEAFLVEARHHPELVALDADLVLDTGLIQFSQEFPDRFIECGIAEQDMVSQASGLALSGLLPAVHSFACFLTPRANEQIYNADTEKTRIIYVGSLAGVLPAGPGHSHQSVRDIALMGSLPNTVAVEPSCEDEVEMAIRWAVRENSGSAYIRLVSIPVDVPFDLPGGYRFVPGTGVALTVGRDVAVFAYGPVLLSEAYRAAEASDLSLRVINLPWLNRFDREWLRRAVDGCRAILCLDNHLTAGGQGERLAAVFAQMGVQRPVRVHGLAEVPACGRNDEVLRYHRLDAAGIEAVARETLGRN